MEKHAVAILQQAESWKWPSVKRIQLSGAQGGKLETIAPKFLRFLITESQRLGGTVLAQFWIEMGTCHPQLKENSKSNRPRCTPHRRLTCFAVAKLESVAFVSKEESLAKVFEGLQVEEVDFSPVLQMAAEFFTHLGVAREDRSSIPPTVSRSDLTTRQS